MWDNPVSCGADIPFDRLGAGSVRQLPSRRPVPAGLSIGSVNIAPATVLAPMAGVTDTVFRRFIRNLGGCGLIMTEFTSSHGVSASLRADQSKKPNRTLQRYLAFESQEHLISAQLF